jgi:hypothetical protein
MRTAMPLLVNARLEASWVVRLHWSALPLGTTDAPADMITLKDWTL